MKPAKLLLLIPPLLALALMGAWILHQRSEIGKIRNAAALRPAPHADRKHETATPKIIDPMKSGWRSFGLEMWRLTTAGDPTSAQTFLAYRERIKQLSVGEISAAVDAIDAESFGDEDAKSRLLGELRRELLEREPRMLLEYARDGIADGRFKRCHHLKEALGKVAAVSPRDAIAWIDEVIENGAFDYAGARRYNPIWLEYEKTLILGLLPAHADLAGERVAGLPPETRDQVLSEHMLALNSTPELQAAFCRICRRFLDPEEVGERVVSMASLAAATGGIASVSRVLTTVEATPAERAEACHASVSGHMAFVARSKEPGLDDVEELRKWVSSQGAGDPEKVTGDALGYLAGRPGFGVDRAFESIRAYHDRSHSDRLLAEFLGWPVAWRDPARCIELAGLIRNENLRKKSMTPP